MTRFGFFISFWIISALSVTDPSKIRLAFYQGANLTCYTDYELKCLPWTITSEYRDVCHNFKSATSELRKSVSSINTFGSCITIYSAAGCTGDEIEISPESKCSGRDLTLCPLRASTHWKNQMVSFRACPVQPIAINLLLEPSQGIYQNLTAGTCDDHFQFTVDNRGQFYAECKDPDSFILTDFCTYQEECNTWKDYETDTCRRVNVTEYSHLEWQSSIPSKKELLVSPGTVTCTNNRRSVSVTLKYFFTGTGRKGLIGSGKEIHFSWKGVNLEDFIVVNFDRKVYYTKELLEVECAISTYAFEGMPAIRVASSNDRHTKEESKFEITYKFGEWQFVKAAILELLEPAPYEITCGAYIYNSSTEWVETKAMVNVTHGEAPYFSLTSEYPTFEVGADLEILTCDAHGIPDVEISWEIISTSLGHISGGKLILTNISPEHARKYICIATNVIGNATKEFDVKINEQRSLIGSIALTISVLTIILLVLFFVYFLVYAMWLRKKQILTEAEIAEFRQGIRQSGACKDEMRVIAESIEYNNQFEIGKENLLFLKPEHLLGEGAYGRVVRGVVQKDGIPIPVAVKTPHIAYIKALLSELKILAYVGTHENIVSLVGAVTKNIQFGELYICTELCESSILEYVKKISSKNITLQMSADQQSSLSIERLVNWAIQIAKGMAFLERRQVVHSDLATRNILLSADKVAKICDFGLSRQVLNYIYVKSIESEDILPFRWMAIESLDANEFSSLSDIWSYGIVLWELFSLAKEPFQEFENPVKLKAALFSGTRLVQPAFASPEMYSLMNSCWVEDPKQRPTFAQIVVELERCSAQFTEYFQSSSSQHGGPNENTNPTPHVTNTPLQYVEF